jgi:peptidyl-prolyl cis-trans isomerase D
LQENGQFSMARYQAALASQGMSQAQFEAQLRQDLTLQQVVGALGDTGIAGSTVTDTMLRIQAEERQIAEWRSLRNSLPVRSRLRLPAHPEVLRRERESL